MDAEETQKMVNDYIEAGRTWIPKLFEDQLELRLHQEMITKQLSKAAAAGQAVSDDNLAQTRKMKEKTVEVMKPIILEVTLNQLNAQQANIHGLVNGPGGLRSKLDLSKDGTITKKEFVQEFYTAIQTTVVNVQVIQKAIFQKLPEKMIPIMKEIMPQKFRDAFGELTVEEAISAAKSSLA